jgi:pimeloyl-ACP methyl ester carboxylesterase
MTVVEQLARYDGETIAYLKQDGEAPGVVWLGGLKSDMLGTKAEALATWASAVGRAFMRFDYFGHGQSSGDFRDGTISRWREDSLEVLDGLCPGPQILVGSSMGGWIALLAALARPEKVKGLLLLAPAPDFTEALMWAEMEDSIRREIMETGEWLRPSEYDEEPYPITRNLIEDGRRNLLLDGPIKLSCPVRIIQGMNDPDVPWSHAMKLMDCIEGNPTITLVKEGDHRLSTEEDLVRMRNVLEALLSEA